MPDYVDMSDRTRSAILPAQAIGALFRPLSFLAIGAGLAAAFAALAQILFARLLGPSGFGTVAAANAMANMLGPLAACGVGLMLIQKHGSEGWAGRRWVDRSLVVMLVGIVAASLCYFVWCLATLEQEHRTAALLLTPLVAAFATFQLAESRFQLEHRYARVAGLQMLKQFSNLAVAVVATIGSWALVGAAAGLGLMATLTALYALWAGTGFLGRRFTLKGHGERPLGQSGQVPPAFSTIVREAWPFAATSFAFLLVLQSSVVIVHAAGGAHAAGLYGAGISILTVLYLLPRILFRKFFLAKVSRWYYHDTQRVALFTRLFVPASALLALPLALAAILSAPVFVSTFLGPEYAQSVPVIQILMLALPLRFVSAGCAVAAVETAHVRERVLVQLVVGAVAIVGTAIAMPTFSIVGAAIVLVAAEAIVAFLFWAVTSRTIAALENPAHARVAGPAASRS